MAKQTVVKLELNDRKYRDDPWSEFARLREIGPVYRARMPLLGIGWVATTYEAASAVLKDSEHFVRNPKNAGRSGHVSWQWMLPKSFKSVLHNMLGADGQDHRRLRSLVDQAFARRNIEGMNQRLETLAGEQLQIAAQILEQEGKVDLVQHYSRPLPLTVICELLGLPAGDRPKFRKWFAPLSNATSILAIFSIGRGMRKLNQYLRVQFEEAKKDPREGLITELVQAEHEGHKLSEEDLLSMVFLLLVAGHETTVHLINNMVLALLTVPQAKTALLADWSKIDAAIEESLRYCTPLQMTKPRFVAQDMEFYGQQLRRGETITPLIACANYDPARFENPHEFVIDREQNYHISFGSGPHTCLGMKLARAETAHAMKTLFDRWPDLQPAFDLKQPEWTKRMGTRSMKTFFVKRGRSGHVNSHK